MHVRGGYFGLFAVCLCGAIVLYQAQVRSDVVKGADTGVLDKDARSTLASHERETKDDVAREARGARGQESSAAREETNTASKAVEISDVGRVEYKEYGRPQSPLIVMIHGASSSTQVVREWERTAALLGSRGFLYVGPDPWKEIADVQPRKSSSSATKSIQKVVDRIVEDKSTNSSFTIMGKSWGGGQALRYVAKHENKVHKIVLVAPMGGDEPSTWRSHERPKIPALLLYAEDDQVFRPHRVSVLKSLLPNLTVKMAASGGHKILPEFDEQIASFVKREGHAELRRGRR
ncbi:hypothetical protein GUITHDRAFT_101417 [Guillardia theta CCMP2712]|uniref:AB hydrolase-1 domain-containing protein n=1 Tax=Guillardia theta (strain CCMP2712) TaxID=905079 RepID=L1JWL3_GUITC|nr:hypothetical protein GUITHDRAFT_101417 [Guillardia theta CCMP2712]EKX52966.1 hypothetical protein GUITHDRAFT_101417 [Guillardia theta CCMP2712]|eukprot:XP_005839946.1 hypothetical protein GUITHDRAFT_101417 [Guillardia theta CCMP2712]